MFDLSGKRCLIAGGSGLIGKTVVGKFKEAGATVTNIDKAEDANINIDVAGIGALVSLFENRIDVFVNATYPKYWVDHLRAYYLPSMEVAEHMAEHGGGSIINFASIYGVVGADYRVYEGTNIDMPIEYAMVKGGIIAMSRALATKYGARGVRVNCISPGGVEDGQSPRFIARYCARVPMARMATPEGIVGAVVFLASDGAKYITGQNIVVDGGLTAW